MIRRPRTHKRPVHTRRALFNALPPASVEPLENRLLFATFLVNTALDAVAVNPAAHTRVSTPPATSPSDPPSWPPGSNTITGAGGQAASPQATTTILGIVANNIMITVTQTTSSSGNPGSPGTPGQGVAGGLYFAGGTVVLNKTLLSSNLASTSNNDFFKP